MTTPTLLDPNYYRLITAEALLYHFSLSEGCLRHHLTHPTNPIPSIVTGKTSPTFHAPTVLRWLATHHGQGAPPEAPLYADPAYYQLVERAEIEHRFLIESRRLTAMLATCPSTPAPVITPHASGPRFHIPTFFHWLVRTYGHGHWPTAPHITPIQTAKAS